MKKRYLVFLFGLLLILGNPTSTFATILYSNDFKSSYTGFIKHFGGCSPGTSGLQCDNGVGIHNVAFSNLKCVSGRFTTTGITNNLENNVIISQDDNGFLNNLIDIVFKPNTNIILNYTKNGVIAGGGSWDTGIKTPIGTHTYTLCQNNNNYTIHIDDTLIESQTIEGFTGKYVGFQLVNGDTLTNFIATDELINTSSGLNVPLFKQGTAPFTNNDPVWEGEEFDHANGGQFTCGKTMAQCGCSTTSVAMVLKYHGIDTLPNQVPLNPGTLNTWLKENNGYNRNAGIDWRVAAALTKKAKANNPNFKYNALEYSRGGSNKELLKADLENGIPNVLEVPGHYIVGTGVKDSSFTINDPFYNRTNLTAYNNTYLSTRRYIPSNTDISYISLFVDPEINITLTDSAGNTIGEEEIEYELNDATSENEPTVTRPSLKILSYAKPSTGTYTITVSAPSLKSYQVDVTIIDQEGNNTRTSLSGLVNTNQNNTYTLQYNKQLSTESIFQKDVTFESTILDIKNAEKQKELNHILRITLQTFLQSAQKQLPKNKQLAIKLLEAGLKILDEASKYEKLISRDAYKIVRYDFTILIANNKW